MIPPNSIVPYQFNRHSPQYQGLQALWSPWTNGGRTGGFGEAVTYTNLPTFPATPYGRAVHVETDTDYDYLHDYPSGAINPYAGTATLWVRVNNRPTEGDQRPMYRLQAGSTVITIYQTGYITGDPVEYNFRTHLAETIQCDDSASSYVIGDLTFYVATWLWTGSAYSTALHKFGESGDYITDTNSGATTLTTIGTPKRFYVGSDQADAVALNYDYYEGRFYNHVLSVQEMWNMWHPNTRFDLYKQAVNPKYFSWTNLYQTKMRPVGGR